MCLKLEELIAKVSNDSDYLTVLEAEEDSPDYCGIYSIKINKLDKLPKKIVDHQLNHVESKNIIYIGMANPKIITKRLVKQDLNNKGKAIFFRKVGSVLGKVAVQGSGKNYKFENNDKLYIIDWIKENLKVKYFKYPIDKYSKNETEHHYESPLIEMFKPAFNYKHVPKMYKCQYIKELHIKNRDIGLNRI